ncbi:dicarboxylate/amino acid:cation symporter, partial [bacterium]|nr:dicarboxylate/amino acid:cation symporter [bacterium]
ITAFSTSSSAVTLPVALDCLEEKCGINPRLTRFMIPLGITINMSGTALFVSAAALYLARAYGHPMTLNAQLSIVFISWITSFGIAGIPSGCLVALMIVLHSLGITNEAIGLIIGFDRILDMFRTICNIFANICCSVIVAYGDGQKLKIS